MFGWLQGCLSAEPAPLLGVVSTTPAPGAAHPSAAPLRIVFDGYLDPDADFERAASLISGDVGASVDVGYDPTGPALVVVPRIDLRAELGYTLVISAEHIRGLDGRLLAEDLRLSFRARAVPPPPSAPPADFRRDLAPALAARCGCHGPEPAAFPPLEPAALIGVPSRVDSGLALVEPGDPLRSALLLKVLPDYPRLRGLGMPPSGPPLSGETIRALVDWIERL